MAEPILVVAKGTQKGFIFLYETLNASIASLKTCSIHKNSQLKKNRFKWSVNKIMPQCKMNLLIATYAEFMQGPWIPFSARNSQEEHIITARQAKCMGVERGLSPLFLLHIELDIKNTSSIGTKIGTTLSIAYSSSPILINEYFKLQRTYRIPSCHPLQSQSELHI